MPITTDDRTVPAPAAWLGGFGLLPFALCSAMAVFSDGALKTFGVTALLGYGAVILSFLGGVHWGLAMNQGSNVDGRLLQRLVVSVLPALVAWPSLWLAPKVGCLLLACAFMAMLLVDVHASQTGIAPQWYRRLRLPLSVTVAVLLIVGVCFENGASP